jgi:phosphatidyl-myo-inositol dimannoside synthase
VTSSLTTSPAALVLLSDGFGGHGGIAKFNRDFLYALCAAPAFKRVIALPRLVPQPGEIAELPQKLTHDTSGVGGKWRYLRAVIRAARNLRNSCSTLNSQLPASGSRLEALRSELPAPGCVVFCAHLNLLPLAWLASRIIGCTVFFAPRSGISAFRFLLSAFGKRSPLPARCSLLLNLHGIDAWTPHRSWLVRKLISRVDAFITVSHFTRRKFLGWARTSAPFHLLPNCVELAAYGPGEKNPALLDRLGLRDRTVLMTLARLNSAERYKGIDEVLEALPEIEKKIPNIAYLICGDGDDRPRLMEKSRALGYDVFDFSFPLSAFNFSVSRPLVVFTGKIAEEQKADYYRIGDAFVMAGWGEGFGIAYLEALACGVPVVGSVLDASQEALLHGQLGVLVNPKDRADLVSGILRAVSSQRPELTALDTFSSERFQQRVTEIVKQITALRCATNATAQLSTLNEPVSCPRPTN